MFCAICKFNFEIANQFRSGNPISKLHSVNLEYEYVFINCTPVLVFACSMLGFVLRNWPIYIQIFWVRACSTFFSLILLPKTLPKPKNLYAP